MGRTFQVEDKANGRVCGRDEMGIFGVTTKPMWLAGRGSGSRWWKMGSQRELGSQVTEGFIGHGKVWL